MQGSTEKSTRSLGYQLLKERNNGDCRLKGKVAEWLNASVLKTGVALQLPRVRIPPFPYFNKNKKPSSFYPFFVVLRRLASSCFFGLLQKSKK